MNPMIISPSMLSADFAHLDRDLKKVEESGADWLHVDIMDGHFVPNITFGPDQLKMLRPCTHLFYDVHLMISKPIRYIPAFAKAGADLIAIHVEAEDDPAEGLTLIKQFGKKAGLVLSPDTPAEAVFPYLDLVDMILVMSVYPGFGGQSFIPTAADKLLAIHNAIGDRPVRLEVDGGINFDTLPIVLQAGADTIVSGSCLFKGDMKANVARFREIGKH